MDDGRTQQVPASAALTEALGAADLAYTEPARARHVAESALAAARDAPEVATAAYRALGMAAAASGHLAAATAHLQRAAAIAESAALWLRAGQARGSLAYVLLLTSGAPAALRELDRADAILRDGVPAARLKMQRGLVLSEIRRFEEATASLDHALVTLEQAGGDDLLEADIRNNRAVARLGLRDWDGAHEELRLAETLYMRSDHSGRTAMVVHNRGVVDALCGHMPAALIAFDDAAERYRVAGLHPGLLTVDRAEALLAVGLVAEARHAATTAVAEFAEQRNAVDLVQARLLLAEAALLDHDPATALVEADRARRSARSQGRPRWAALGAYLRIQARWRSGAPTPSMLRACAQTATELTEAGWPAQSQDLRLIMARTALSLGRPDLARRQLVAARSARRTGLAELRVRAWHAEAILRRSEGDRVGAARAVRAGLTILDEFRASLGATDIRAHVSVHAAELAQLGVRLAVESGRPEAIFAAAERGRAGALRFRPARPPDDAQLASDLAELRQVVSDQRADEVVGSTRLVARQRVLEQAVRARARHASGDAAPADRPPSRAALRDTLGGSTLIEYLEFDGKIHAVTMTTGRLTWHELAPVTVIERAVEALRTGLSLLAMGVGSPRSAAGVQRVVDRSARELDELLITAMPTGPVDLPVVIVPTGVLHALPWAALPSCAARAVSVAPSAALWHRAATDSRPPGGSTVLAHGPGLQHAGAELDELARLYPTAISLTAAAATVASLLAALDGAGTAHLAAHGHFRADNPMFSELRFADGPLTVYDLERLDVPPRHVVLASCDSGLASVSSGNELIGLAAALLAMGSTTLVAAVIPVPDEASRAMMLLFHQSLIAGNTAAEALRIARTRTIERDDTSTPAQIAASGFVCFGSG